MVYKDNLWLAQNLQPKQLNTDFRFHGVPGSPICKKLHDLSISIMKFYQETSKNIAITVLAWVLVGWAGVSNASLLNDDSIMYSVDLATSSGNSISTSGTFVPGADVYCFSFLGLCPPRPLYDTGILDNTNEGLDLFLLFNAEAESISVLIVDYVVGVPELITGTITYSDIGWGDTGGQIVGGEVCGIGFSGCGPAFGFEPEFSADAVTIAVDSFLSIFSSSSGVLTGIGQVTVEFDVEHVPAPATLALFGIGLACLRWSRRKKA